MNILLHKDVLYIFFVRDKLSAFSLGVSIYFVKSSLNCFLKFLRLPITTSVHRRQKVKRKVEYLGSVKFICILFVFCFQFDKKNVLQKQFLKLSLPVS